MNFIKKILAFLMPPGAATPARREKSDVSYELGNGYESEYPMLPKEVVHKAVEGGFDFHGSLGPENVLDIKLFRALARVLKRKGPDAGMVSDLVIEDAARELAHDTYDFYLDFFTLPKDTAQQKSIAFWHNLLKL